jgi:hypothetical protein
VPCTSKNGASDTQVATVRLWHSLNGTLLAAAMHDFAAASEAQAALLPCAVTSDAGSGSSAGNTTVVATDLAQPANATSNLSQLCLLCNGTSKLPVEAFNVSANVTFDQEMSQARRRPWCFMGAQRYTCPCTAGCDMVAGITLAMVAVLGRQEMDGHKPKKNRAWHSTLQLGRHCPALDLS